MEVPNLIDWCDVKIVSPFGANFFYLRIAYFALDKD